jgi:DeoR family fructose operon transcriptional repressor
LSDAVGGFDLGLVGVNGVDIDAGFTTHDNAEAINKADILNVSRTRIIVGDSSKIGLALECKFAHFKDDVQYVVNDEAGNERLRQLVSTYSSKIILA